MKQGLTQIEKINAEQAALAAIVKAMTGLPVDSWQRVFHTARVFLGLS